MYFARKNDSDVSRDEEEVAQDSSAEEESDSNEAQIDEDASDDSDDDEFELNAEEDDDDDDDSGEEEDDEDDDENEDDQGESNENSMEDNGKEKSSKKLKATRTSKEIQKGENQVESKTMYVYLPGTILVDIEPFIRSLCSEVVKVRRSSVSTARFCLVDFNSFKECIQAVRILRKVKLNDRPIYATVSKDSSDEFLENKAAQLKQKKDENPETNKNLSNVIQVFNIPAPSKLVDIMKYFPEALEVKLSNYMNPNKPKTAVVTFPTPAAANEARLSNIFINGKKLFMRFVRSLPEGSKGNIGNKFGTSNALHKTYRSFNYNKHDSTSLIKFKNEKNSFVKKDDTEKSVEGNETKKSKQKINEADESFEKKKKSVKLEKVFDDETVEIKKRKIENGKNERKQKKMKANIDSEEIVKKVKTSGPQKTGNTVFKVKNKKKKMSENDA